MVQINESNFNQREELPVGALLDVCGGVVAANGEQIIPVPPGTPNDYALIADDTTAAGMAWKAGGGGGGSSLRRTVHLTAADIRALATVPFELVPAPAAGKFIAAQRAIFSFHVGSHLYPDASLNLVYEGSNAEFYQNYYRTLYSQTDAVTYGSADLYAGFSDIPAAALQLVSSGSDPGGAAIATAVLHAGGLGYLPDDSVTVNGGSSVAYLVVDTTDGTAAITAAAVHQGGAGYAPGDTGQIHGAEGNAAYRVDTVDGDGAVLTFTLTQVGSSYVAGATATTTKLNGNGDDNFTIDIVSTDGTGAVLTFHSATGGSGYSVANDVATTSLNNCVGSGFTIDITEAAQGDGTMDVTTLYTIEDA